MAAPLADVSASPAVRCGTCAARPTPTRPVTGFWVAAFSWQIGAGRRREHPRERRFACPACWAFIEALDATGLAARSVMADLADGRNDTPLAAYQAVYAGLIASVEQQGLAASIRDEIVDHGVGLA